MIPGHERNEPLDCRNYANAAFKALPKNLDAIDRQLKIAKGQKVATVPAQTAPKKKPAHRKARGGASEKYYDNW